nr:MAG TPA: hypothetical protein [Caudoviricetes sp.]
MRAYTFADFVAIVNTPFEFFLTILYLFVRTKAIQNQHFTKVKCRARVPFVTQESLFVNENLIL